MSSVWTLIPHVGIESGSTQIHMGQSRPSIRESLAPAFGKPTSHYDGEDDFRSPDGTFIRLRYSDQLIQDIEFLAGQLTYHSQPLSGRTDWPDITRFLNAEGVTIRESEWLGDGFDCLELAINIATHEQVGGDEGDNGIEWVILSTQFTA